MEFVSAKDLKRPRYLIMGMIGMSMSGKTYSALELAVGLGNRIALVETAGEQSDIYSEVFDYALLEFAPPYSPDRYMAVLDKADAYKPDVLIVDNVSEEWDGDGGCLELHASEQERLAKKWNVSDYDKVNMSAWAEVKKSHAKLLRRLKSSPYHVILVMQGKTKINMKRETKNRKTRTVIEDAGVQPIIAKDLPRILMANVLLTGEGNYTPFAYDKKYKAIRDPLRPIFERHKTITRNLGQELAAWAAPGNQSNRAAAPESSARKTQTPSADRSPPADQSEAPADASFDDLEDPKAVNAKLWNATIKIYREAKAKQDRQKWRTYLQGLNEQHLGIVRQWMKSGALERGVQPDPDDDQAPLL